MEVRTQRAEIQQHEGFEQNQTRDIFFQFAERAMGGQLAIDNTVNNANAEENLRTVSLEMEAYENMSHALEKRIEHKNLLEWWNGNQFALPNLHFLAMTMLAIPASSSSVECYFSTAAHINSPKRSRIAGSTFESLMMVNRNRHLESETEGRLRLRNASKIHILIHINFLALDEDDTAELDESENLNGYEPA